MHITGLDNPIIAEDIERIIADDLPWETFRDTTVLVTGASGMIPSYVLCTLLALNDRDNLNIRVLALVRNEQKARRILGSLLDRSDLTLLVQDVTAPLAIDGPVDYIIHGAGPARPAQHQSAPTATIRAALIGTFHLLDLAVSKGNAAFVLMSSSEVYGKVSDDLESITETDYGYLDCLNPRSCYSEGKRAAETICASYHAQYGIDCRIVRFAHIYGPGLSPDDGRVQADFAANVFRGENIVMKSDGSARRAYTYVSDAVSGLFYALLLGTEPAYNVADSEHVISIRQLAEAFLASRPEKQLELVMDIDENTTGKYNPARFIGLDDRRIKSLGWIPKVGIGEGTSRMVAHFDLTANERQQL